ncbi:MAG: hypothetical protein RJA81_1467 [Planctomycetota bacterium]|jgi:predicted acyltransferase
MSELDNALIPEENRNDQLVSAPEPAAKPPRLVSLDQLRGFTVACMFVVNFSGGLKAMPEIIKHHNVYESLADWVMPTFMFMVGFSFRLSWLSHTKREGTAKTVWKFLIRGLLLVGISLFLYAGEDDIKIEKWSEISQESISSLVVSTLKANLWETLAIIGCAQILVLPMIGLSSRIRFLLMIALMIGHVAISYAFNWNFVHGKPNFLDDMLGSNGKTAWDGGFFGLMSWGSMMLAGSLVHGYVMNREKKTGAIPGLLLMGLVVGFLGWGLSGLSRLYDVPADNPELAKADKLAESPVLPDFSKASGRSLGDLIAEPPLVPPPGPDQRKVSYWMMYKKMVSLPFVVFNIGVSIALLGLFMILCDVIGLRCSVLERFGQNALAAYCIHHYVEGVQHLFVPKDSPAWWCWINLILFMIIVDRALAWMQRNKIRFTV